MACHAETLALVSATCFLLEAHARQIARTESLRSQSRKIQRILRKRWRHQLKVIIDQNTLRDLREAVDPETSNLILRALMPGAVLIALSGLVSRSELEVFDKALLLAIGAGAAQTAADLEKALSGINLGSFERDYIRVHGFDKLAKDIDRTTVKRLQDAVSQAYQDGGSFDELVKVIKGTFRGFSQERAELIAQTELNAAYNNGGLEFGKQVGGRKKRWNPLGDNVCPICVANEAQGWIPISTDFQSGASSPPQHPRCMCVIDVGFLPD